MGVDLPPLEFTECLADSPHFRENLQRHEKELERTSQQIKKLIKEVKDVVHAAKRLGAAQLALAASMEQFEFECIGASMTEDERVISHSLHHFAHLIRTVEDERDRMLGRAHEQIIQPLERFRKEHIGAVKEGKKKFDKKTAKFCQSQERTLSLSTKKPDNVFKEADAALEMAERDFCQASLEYVFQLQAVQERKKFELVETLLGFVFGWWTFHHTAHDVHADAEPLVRDLQLRIQRTRTNFEETSKQTESLMKKMMDLRQLNKEEEGGEDGVGGVARAGYLFLMEKKAFGTAWTKQYCSYKKSSQQLKLLPFNQINVKTTSGAESVCVCGARSCSEPVERRFCWEAVPAGSERPPLTLQALGERDRSAWMRALHAPPDRDPRLLRPDCGKPAGGEGEADCALDEAGFAFVRALIAELEARGLEDQGLYRVAGVASKVSRLGPRRLPGAAALRDPLEWDSRTLTSALKSYLRALPEPLATRALHKQFIAAVKCESRSERVARVATLVRALPRENYEMLHLVITHLRNVVAKSDKNLMTASNLAVCFGPTLMRAERETVASILELKFYNVLVETLIEHYDAVFGGGELPAAPSPAAPLSTLAPLPAAPLSSLAPLAPLVPPAAHLHNGLIRTSPGSMSTSPRSDLCASAGAGALVRYSPHHQQLLQQLSPHAPALRALRGVGRSSSSSAESVSSGGCGAGARVRTLYACLGESDGELSFDANQIIDNVAPSGEPGWLRGTLAGRTGLVPENYVEPLP